MYTLLYVVKTAWIQIYSGLPKALHPFISSLKHSKCENHNRHHKITEISRCSQWCYIMASAVIFLPTTRPSLPLLCLCRFTTPSPVLLSPFSLLHPLYTDQNLEFHWHTVCLSQSDTSHHGNRAEPGLHFSLHPPPSVISPLWRSQVEEGGGREGRYQINPLCPAARLRHIGTEGHKDTPGLTS